MAGYLTAPPPEIGPDEAISLARTHYGLEILRAESLTAERDQNLRVTAADGQSWIMKLTNPAEPRLMTEFQTVAMQHLENSASGLPLPRLRYTPEGAASVLARLADGRECVMRLITWLDGIPLAQAPKSPAQRRNAARLLAGLDLAFQGLSHPGQHEYMQWNISELLRKSDHLPYIDDPELRALVAGVLEEFEKRALPELQARPQQVIYNDLNHYNLLVDAEDPDQITGLIDFGDITSAPLINDLAVAAAYQFGPEGDLDGVCEFIAGYHEVLPLSLEDIAILPLLIAARLSMTLLITGYRAGLYPENARYILRNNGPARLALRNLRTLDTASRAAFFASCLEGPNG